MKHNGWESIKLLFGFSLGDGKDLRRSEPLCKVLVMPFEPLTKNMRSLSSTAYRGRKERGVLELAADFVHVQKSCSPSLHPPMIQSGMPCGAGFVFLPHHRGRLIRVGQRSTRACGDPLSGFKGIVQVRRSSFLNQYRQHS